MIRTLERDFLSPLLQQHGFRKSGLTWNRPGTEVTQVFNVQLSRYSNPGQIDLTFNVGLWMPAVWSICWHKQAPNFIEEDDCFPRFRIGDLLANFCEDPQDVWWSLQSGEGNKQVAQELGEILSRNVLPFLSRFTSMLEVKIFCDTSRLRLMPADKLYYAILSHMVGDRASYERLIVGFTDEKLRAWQPRVLEVVRRLEASA